MIYSSVKRHDLCYAVSESPVKGSDMGVLLSVLEISAL